MTKKLLSFDSYGLADITAVVLDWGGQIRSAPNIRQVGGSAPVFIGSRMDSRQFTVHFL